MILDVLIGLSYIVIAGMLVYLMRRERQEIRFRIGFLLLAFFLVACAGTYYLAVVSPHRPFVRLSGYVKAITALASVATAVILAVLVPRLLRAMETTRVLRRESEEPFRLLLEGAKEHSILMLDPEGKILTWNAGAQQITGYTAEEMIGLHFACLSLPEDQVRKLPEEELESARVFGRAESEGWRVRKDGNRYWANVVLTALKDESGDIRGFAKVMRDMSERKRAEDALRASEKQAVVGRLAAVVAHEINNPLESLTNLFFLLGEHISDEGPSRTYLEMAQQEVSRIAHITKQTLGFYRESTAPVAVRLTDIVQNVLNLLAHRVQLRKITVVREFFEPSEIQGFPVEMRQVFTNLVGNALDAVGHGGMVRIRVVPARHWRNSQIRGVRVVIADNGHGISPENRRRIFEPFFTTKAEHGTGLGLWVSGTIIHKHGGSVKVRSSVRPGRNGTCFSVFLPSSTEQASELRFAG
jgi:two-component system, chemotaxis family, CheB/CheR fusion protein